MREGIKPMAENFSLAEPPMHSKIEAPVHGIRPWWTRSS